MPTESSSKPARDWSVNTSQEPPAKPAAATPPSAVVRPKVLAKPAAVPTATPPSAVVRPKVLAKPTAAPVAAPQAAVVRPKVLAKPTHAPAASTDAEADRAARRAAHLNKIMAPPPSGGKTAPIAIALALALLVGGAVVSCHTKHKAAEQRIAQASAAVNGYVGRATTLKEQSASFLQQLDGALGDLQAIASAKAPGKDFQQRFDAAIATVGKVENTAFAPDNNPEQLTEALETLKGRPDHAAQAEKVRAAAAEIKSQQNAIDAKCQKVRAMIVSADQQMRRLGIGAK